MCLGYFRNKQMGKKIIGVCLYKKMLIKLYHSMCQDRIFIIIIILQNRFPNSGIGVHHSQGKEEEKYIKYCGRIAASRLKTSDAALKLKKNFWGVASQANTSYPAQFLFTTQTRGWCGGYFLYPPPYRKTHRVVIGYNNKIVNIIKKIYSQQHYCLKM